MQLVEFDGEEDRDRDSVRLALTKYNPLFKSLFDKYTGKSKLKSKTPTLAESEIGQNELIKCLRDHNINHSMMTKTELLAFIKLINRKMISRLEEDGLEYQGFVHLFVQLAIFFHTRSRFSSPHETGGKPIHLLTYGDMIENLITWLRNAAESRGQ